MDKEQAIRTLKAHEAELRALGVQRLSLFGSLARGEAGPESDVDIAAEFNREMRVGMFRFVEINDRLREMLGTAVDLVGEPARRPRMQAEIDRDRIHVF
jgi:predicted nucleotidyltransferase